MNRSIIAFTTLLSTFVVGLLAQLFLHGGIEHSDWVGKWPIILPIFLIITGGLSALYAGLYSELIKNSSFKVVFWVTLGLGMISVIREIIWGVSGGWLELSIPIIGVVIFHFIEARILASKNKEA